ncbi:hypothetical protein, partial [Escherichia coli]|uniref:hypothetical protein n=1 Tax=Escherichia coli TaxID=562 RepID=UPI00197E0540
CLGRSQAIRIASSSANTPAGPSWLMVQPAMCELQTRVTRFEDRSKQRSVEPCGAPRIGVYRGLAS